MFRCSKSETSSLPGFTISPIGVIPKCNRQNKWRLIVDLSSPKGASVNDGISSSFCSLSYASIDDAVKMLVTLGKGTLMAKLDLKDAYCAVPVYPHDCPLLGMQWKGRIFIDTTLPFGLRSAPKIFSAVADGLLWMIHEQGFTHALHYLDDFLLLDPPESSQCQKALTSHSSSAETWESRWQMKQQRAHHLLGIEIDSCNHQLRLPQEKPRNLFRLLTRWMLHNHPPRQGYTPCRTGTKRDLLSLIGLLNHAAMVVRPGRTFLHSMIDCSTTVTHLDHQLFGHRQEQT